jgi:O-antigen/teichoic acid export membrane protein
VADHLAQIARPAVDDGHQLARGAAANVLVLIAANFRGVFTFLIARLLGQAALGRFGLVFTVTDLLSKPATLGLEEGMVPLVAARMAATDGVGARQIFRRGLMAALLASTALVLVAIPSIEWLARSFHFEAFAGGTTLMVLALPGITLARLSTAASRATLSMRNEFYSRGLVETWVTTAVFLIAIAIGVRDRAPAVSVVLGSLASGIVAYLLARRALARAPGSNVAGRRTLWEALRFSAPIAGSGLLNVLMINIDVLLLGAYVGRVPGVTVEGFGVFCAASEIAGGMRKVRQVFDPIFAPVAATRALSDDAMALRHTVEGPGRWMLAAQLPLVGVLMLASGAVLSIYGSGFRQGALWLALLAVAHGSNSFAGLVETLLIVKRPTLNLVNAAITVSLQALISILLIPRIGITGAALAMCIGFAAQGAIRFAEVRHVFGWSWPWHSLRRPLVAFGIAMVPALAVRLAGGLVSEIISALVFAGLYAAAWTWLGADPTDREIWRRLTSRGRDEAVSQHAPLTRVG